MTVQKSYVIKGKPESNWVLFDASQQNLGRLSTRIAEVLLGKHKPTFTPGVDMGDYVVVTNVEKLQIAPKQLTAKMYYRHSGYPGGLKEATMDEMLRKHPDRIIRRAVWGMLPHNRLGRKLLKRLKIFVGSEHSHEAQNPQPLS
ncbi:MAG: 50S ribosomal protein L13 [Anaerolineaceae bacterium]